jgi:hypothetical protein
VNIGMPSARWQDQRQRKMCFAACQQEHAHALDITATFWL